MRGPSPLLLVAVVLSVCGLAGCEPVQPPGGGGPLDASAAAGADAAPAASFDVGEIKPVAEYLREPRFANADLRRGELLSLSCQACHTLRAGEAHNLGPNLSGVFGRRAGTRPGFEYSKALMASGLVWTPRSLEAWLEEPAKFVEGTEMAFTGFRSASDRRDLIAYLMTVTATPVSD